jgi:hypothetical protein
LSYEAELLALAVIFYLYDSSVLLYSNETVFICDGSQRWSATSGWIGFLVGGRSLCALNPFTPHRPSFRLSWDFDALPEGNDLSWAERAQRNSKLRPWTLAAGVALYVLLPLGMFTSLGRYAVIPALFLLYGSTIVALIQLRRSESLLALSRKRFWGFAFECMACPPFAVNMVRRMTLAEWIKEPVPLAAVRLLDAERWNELRQQCMSRIDDAIQLVAEDSPELKALEAQKQRLSALVSRQ